ncbi:Ankyrin repeat [Mactra antiquata]
MGDEEEPKSARTLEIPITQLEDKLWKIVTEGKVKNLLAYINEFKTHTKFKTALNSVDPEYDEDGANIVSYCVKVGRDKGSSFTGKDHGSCLAILVENGANINHKDKANRTPLSWAVYLRYHNYVNKLLKLGADVTIPDQDGYNPFHLAVQSGSKDIVTAIIDNDKKIIDIADQHGVPPLVTAVKHKQLEVCRLLLDQGANVNGLEQKQKRTAVYYAIKQKHMEMLDLLLKHNPRLDTIDCKGRSILYLCCELTDTRFFHKVIGASPNFSKSIMNQPADEEKTPVIIACQNGNSEQLKHLLENGATVKASDTSGKSALHHCADNLETQCAEMLLEKDKSILEVKDEQGYTALALAVLVGNTNLIKLLLEKGADIHTDDNEGHKLSHWAAVCGHLKVLDILINNKAEMSSPDNHHAYPIHYAAQMNSSNSGNTESRISEKVLRKFIDCKVELDVLDDAGRQPLLWAACSGNADSCRMLLKAGADINSTDQDDLTALHCAASRGHYDCIEVLRKGGADVNKIDKNKCTPLFYAITLGNKDCTQALIKAKANVNHVDDRGRNPVHCAAIKGSLDTVKLLEKESADLWHQNNKGDYPIHEAAQKGHSDVVKYFLNQRNDKDAVNVTNKVGKTLLHIAAATNNLPLCKLLINADCDKNALMKHAGKEFTPYDIAVLKGNKDTADFLKKKGALPFSDLSNIQKRESKSARSRRSARSNIETVKEDGELNDEQNIEKSDKFDDKKFTKTKSPKHKVVIIAGDTKDKKGDNTSDKKKVENVGDDKKVTGKTGQTDIVAVAGNNKGKKQLDSNEKKADILNESEKKDNDSQQKANTNTKSNQQSNDNKLKRNDQKKGQDATKGIIPSKNLPGKQKGTDEKDDINKGKGETQETENDNKDTEKSEGQDKDIKTETTSGESDEKQPENDKGFFSFFRKNKKDKKIEDSALQNSKNKSDNDEKQQDRDINKDNADDSKTKDNKDPKKQTVPSKTDQKSSKKVETKLDEQDESGENVVGLKTAMSKTNKPQNMNKGQNNKQSQKVESQDSKSKIVTSDQKPTKKEKTEMGEQDEAVVNNVFGIKTAMRKTDNEKNRNKAQNEKQSQKEESKEPKKKTVISKIDLKSSKKGDAKSKQSIEKDETYLKDTENENVESIKLAVRKTNDDKKRNKVQNNDKSKTMENEDKLSDSELHQPDKTDNQVKIEDSKIKKTPGIITKNDKDNRNNNVSDDKEVETNSETNTSKQQKIGVSLDLNKKSNESEKGSNKSGVSEKQETIGKHQEKTKNDYKKAESDYKSPKSDTKNDTENNKEKNAQSETKKAAVKKNKTVKIDSKAVDSPQDDDEGKDFTPYDLAIIKGYKEAAEYLKQKGALPHADVSNIENGENKEKKESPKENNQKKVDNKDSDKQKPKAKKEKTKTKEKETPKSPKKEQEIPVVIAGDNQKNKEKEKESEKVDEPEKDTVENKDKSKSPTEEKKEDKKQQSPQTTPVKSPNEGKTDAEKLQKKLNKKFSADSVLEKEDGIRTSAVSLRSDSSVRYVGKKGSKLANGTLSPTSSMGQSQGKKKDAGKYVTLEKIQPQVPPEDGRTSADEEKQAGRKASKRPQKGQRGVDFDNDNDDSGTETDREYHSRPKHAFKVTSKPYLDQVHESVWRYQTRRNKSRRINQMKRAQIHTGPMHDIVMFSKMMDNYRKGIVGEEEETAIRNYANWDGYLNDQLRFVSHLYDDDKSSETPRDVQEMAQVQHRMLESEAHLYKLDTELKCKLIQADQEYQRKKNQDMDKEIDTLASRTAEMFDNVKTGATNSLASAKSKNVKLRDDMRRSREERIQSATDPHERAYLQRQELEDRMEDQNSEVEKDRKERYRQWHRHKDEEMRRRLLQAYRPFFPNDVFSKKSVCVSGGRVKSAGRLKVDMSTSSSPAPRRTFQSPRPMSTKSGTLDTTVSSTAQYKLNNEKTQVQMTPYGLRRVRNQDRPTYEEVEAELADAIFFNNDRCTKSADAAANWSRKYDGSIRPRTSLVFVEPRVYDDLVKEEKDAKQTISSKVRHQLTNGDAHPAGDSDSLVS